MNVAFVCLVHIIWSPHILYYSKYCGTTETQERDRERENVKEAEKPALEGEEETGKPERRGLGSHHWR